ncbi:MAG TPA: rhomboid family intramembrane serine protease [Stellaceae bacterium]|jgi:membrane associated rhomboid family serine protease|nr:rhomboid family intramembrane serine protease [Stellaceae bacterium]
MIFAVPLSDDNPTVNTPILTYFLIGTCVGAFLWQLGHNEGFILYAYGMIPAELFGIWRPARNYQVLAPWAKVLTSMFLHGGWFHLLGNMLYLWIFGNNVEDVLGRGRYLLLYLTCGIVAALAQAFANPTSHIPMVGASGAIAGVLGAYLLLHPGANVRCFVWIVIFFRIVNVPAWAMLGLWFAMQLASGLMAAPGRPGVAFWAHVGGFVTGLVLVIVLRPSGVTLLQPARSQAFATAPPGSFVGRHSSYRGSVPQAGRRPIRLRNPWE